MRFFYEINYGYLDVIDNVVKVEIRKINNKKTFIIHTSSGEKITKNMNDISLAYWTDTTTMTEYFRYTR